MPPVLEALQAVFPDLLPHELGAPVTSAEDPNEAAQQPAAADASSCESRIRAISSQVRVCRFTCHAASTDTRRTAKAVWLCAAVHKGCSQAQRPAAVSGGPEATRNSSS